MTPELDRRFNTSSGSIDLAIPKLREGNYFPDWLLVLRRRAEQALVRVIGQAYVEGVSTRRVDDLVKAMGIDEISKSEVSRMTAELDAKVAEFRDRPLDTGPVSLPVDRRLDPEGPRRRPGGERLRVIATSVNAEGRRETSASTSSPPRTPRRGRPSCAPWWPWAGWGGAGHLRRPRRHQGGYSGP